MRQQLDAAIGLAPQVGELYFLRHEVRIRLKEVRYDDAADADLIMYHRLCPDAR